MKKILLRIIVVLFVLYILICGLLFFFQEKIIFSSERLDKNFKFSFAQKFEEINIKTKDGKFLNGLLFRADSAKGLIFYLHGGEGSVREWGGIAQYYTKLTYDIFILDYRGYGKSEGSNTSQNQFFEDVQMAYNEMKKRYSEDKIVVLGYSLGTGPAAKIASTNKPKQLVLEAPYYSMTDMMKNSFPVIPTFILKYKFDTNKYLKECKVPVVIFHGNRDTQINYRSSIRLKEALKNTDTLIILNGTGHWNIRGNPVYTNEIKKLLSQ